MKVEHLKVTGFEEALRGMRNAYNSWDKADTEIIRNVVPEPGNPEFVNKLKKYDFKTHYSQDAGNKYIPYIKDEEVRSKLYYDRAYFDPWKQEYQIAISKEMSEKYKEPIDVFNFIREKIQTDNVVLLGFEDLDLAQRLISHDEAVVNGGQPNEKFLRDIKVSLDLTASFDFWKEYDTYKVGTVANSCSTMHTITKHPITIENISVADLRDKDIENIKNVWLPILNDVVNDDSLSNIEKTRILSKMNLTGFEQKRTLSLNYQVIKNMDIWRSGHKLYEWRKLIDVYFKNLPYINAFINPNCNLYLNKNIDLKEINV